jgi:Phytanoyl-CoA dioxygenase (PhyH)
MDSTHTSPYPLTATQGLTQQQLATFDRDGYLIIPDALDPQTVSSLLEETHSLLDSFSLDNHPMTKFSTGEGSNHVGDDYFLESGDKIRFFFEEGNSVELKRTRTIANYPQMRLIPPAPSPNPKPWRLIKSVITSTF